MTDIGRDQILSREEEAELARRWRDHQDEAAASELVARNLRFVVKVTMPYRKYGIPMSDLIQEGNLGLIRAVAKFDPDKGNRLISYAVWWIKAYIHSYIVRSWSLVRIGTTQAQRRLFHRLPKALSMPGIPGETQEAKIRRLAEELHALPREVLLIMNALNGRDLSLDVPIHGDEGGVTFRERIQCPQDNPETATLDGLDAAHRQRLVAEAVDGLNDREREIIKARYLAVEPSTLREVGDGMGLSRERVRQLESQALRKLKTRVQARYRYTRAA